MKKFIPILVVIVLVVVGYFVVTGNFKPSGSWQNYTHTSTSTGANFSFDYPDSWQKPQTQDLGDIERIVFNNGLVIQAGYFKDQETGQNMTVSEAVENDINSNPGEPKTSTTTIAGVSAQKVTFTVPEGHIGKKEDGTLVPPQPIDITDIFITETNSTSTPLVFLRFSQGDENIFNNILESFSFSE